MFCPKCGAQNPDSSQFCASCGTPLTQAGQNPPGDPGQQPGYGAPQGAGQNPAGYGYGGAQVNQAAKKKSFVPIILLVVILLVILILDRKMLLRADFMLLLTFVAFFVFAGNLARIHAVKELLRTLLSGREYLTSLLASQVISNVPAALLLSNFTENAKMLVRGVNVGGLGTPIASLASLISLKLYTGTENARTGKFLLEFTVFNLVLLIILSGVQIVIL